MVAFPGCAASRKSLCYHITRGVLVFIRYRRSEDGKPVAKALVYIRTEHGIDRSKIDPDAIRIIEHLRNNGHEAYIVGGAVRDLLLGRTPKDFDLVTDAQPTRIRRIFRNSRVIGKRFRLVHVYVGSRIYEVATFRSTANGTVGNEFGTMDEDAMRRDFTFNALYYNTHDDTLVDYVGGYKDIVAKRVKPVIPIKTIFAEDAVRMIRCVKYASSSDFRIPFTLRRALKRDAPLLADSSTSRLTEEFSKILASGNASRIVKGLSDFELLGHMLPEVDRRMRAEHSFRTSMYASLDELDELVRSSPDKNLLSALLAHFIKPPLESRPELLSETSEAFRDALLEARNFLSPLNPPRVELEAAVMMLFKRRGLSPMQKPHREAPPGTAFRSGQPRRRVPRARSV
jgi:poly(A) polymerase